MEKGGEGWIVRLGRGWFKGRARCVWWTGVEEGGTRCARGEGWTGVEGGGYEARKW